MPVDTIAAVEARILRLPTIRPHALAMATMQEQRTVLVTVKTAAGLEGLGEAATIGGLSYVEESPESIKGAIETYCAPLIQGMDATRPGAVMTALNTGIAGNYFAKSAIETALFDLAGKRTGLPVSELLGGRVRDRLPVLWVLASGDTDADIAEAEDMLATKRHNTFKLKIGKRGWHEDVAHVAEIKAALGARASVRVDVNQAWDFATARQAVPALAEAGVDLIEQPLAGWDLPGAAELRQPGGAAIMADEAVRGGPPAAFGIVADRAADAISLKPAQCGGLAACRDVAAIAGAGGLGLYGGTMLEAGVGTAASAQLFATLPRLDWGTELFAPLLFTEEILATPLDYRDFELVVPDGPGLGVALNDAAVKEFAE